MIADIHVALEGLKLRKMREIVEAELKSAQAKKTSYSAFLLDLLRQEQEDKRRRSVDSRIRQAFLPDRWTLETYPFALQPCVSKKQHQEFAELDFIAQAENIVWMGGTGVGKTGLASSILLKALYGGRTGRLVKAQDLFDEFAASMADRSTQGLLKRLSRVDVLLIDELGYVEPKPGQINNFFRLIENRYNKRPTLITTNLGYKEWPKFLGRGPMASALLRRLLHRCHTVSFPRGVNL
ncbi:MAG: ATP-binding protein, partial [Pseudomonadota bacterium]